MTDQTNELPVVWIPVEVYVSDTQPDDQDDDRRPERWDTANEP